LAHAIHERPLQKNIIEILIGEVVVGPKISDVRSETSVWPEMDAFLEVDDNHVGEKKVDNNQ
jgi:hypothetical protein